PPVPPRDAARLRPPVIGHEARVRIAAAARSRAGAPGAPRAVTSADAVEDPDEWGDDDVGAVWTAVPVGTDDDPDGRAARRTLRLLAVAVVAVLLAIAATVAARQLGIGEVTEGAADVRSRPRGPVPGADVAA